MTGVVGEITESNAHVVVDRVGNRDGEAHAENAVSQRNGVEIAIAEEEQAGCSAPHKREHHQDGVGDVSDGEEDGGERDGRCAAHAEAQEPQQDINLQDELLHERPYGVSGDVHGDRHDAIEGVQRVQAFRNGEGGEEDGDGGEDDP